MRGVLKFNEPLAPYTSWRIGGPADKYYRPADSDDLAEFLAALPPEEPVTWLGLGSNVLIHDKGIRGTVIHTLSTTAEAMSTSSVNAITEVMPCSSVEHKVLRVQAGLPCAKLAKYCAKHGLLGAEFFAGIPGTLGGALAMNAGAFGSETWRHLVLVEVINRQGERIFRLPSQYQIGYRSVIGPKDEWFIAGHFQFSYGEGQEISSKIKGLLAQRNATQPIGTFSCGSVFKNPEGHYAGELIEKSQLKDFKIGDAQISSKHANFILNLGKASASDILQLIEHVQQTVLRDHQVQLHPEVRLLGF